MPMKVKTVVLVASYFAEVLIWALLYVSTEGVCEHFRISQSSTFFVGNFIGVACWPLLDAAVRGFRKGIQESSL